MSNDATKFLVCTDEIAGSRASLFGRLILRSLSKSTLLEAVLAKARARGGYLDIRIVIEGEELTVEHADEMLTKAWSNAVESRAIDIVDRNVYSFVEKIKRLTIEAAEQFSFEVSDDEL